MGGGDDTLCIDSDLGEGDDWLFVQNSATTILGGAGYDRIAFGSLEQHGTQSLVAAEFVDAGSGETS